MQHRHKKRQVQGQFHNITCKMASTMKILSNIHKIRHFSNAKRNFTAGKILFDKGSSSSASVPGLSDRVVKVEKEPVGPGAGKNTDYKNPEYFCYNNTSYFEAEVEMLKFRCPQPSIHEPYHQNIPK